MVKSSEKLLRFLAKDYSLDFLEEFETERFRIINITEESESELISKVDEVREEIKYIGKWSSRSGLEYERTIEDCFAIGFELPPGFSPEAFQFMAIQIPQNNKIIGYLGLCHNYPEEKNLWVSIIGLKTDFHGMGIGREIIFGLENRVKESNFYEKIQAGIDLKNWPALRFFTSIGYDKISKILGDDLYAEYKFAKVVLEKDIES